MRNIFDILAHQFRIRKVDSMSCKTLKRILIISVIMLSWACSLPVVRTEDIPDSHIPLNTGVKDASFLTNMEKEIIVELNAIRTNPQAICAVP